MNMIRSLSCIALAVTLTLGSALSAHAASATSQLYTFDKTTYSGALNVSVDLYAPPDKYGKVGAPQRYPATLLFERPDRFRLVLHPGAKDEFRAVAQAGIVNWLDLATGISGKDAADKITDPLAIALLGSAGELLRFSAPKDLVLSKGSKISGARFTPKTWGSGVTSGLAWFSSAGQPIGFEFLLHDQTRVFVSVLSFKQNVKTNPGDFQL
ncbi:MAG: hypothetical protein HOP03_09600 [Lysobacter sp.]|nr:hypothetical protein [Lysobacter sp.]